VRNKKTGLPHQAHKDGIPGWMRRSGMKMKSVHLPPGWMRKDADGIRTYHRGVRPGAPGTHEKG
jgi:hypothetical protein